MGLYTAGAAHIGKGTMTIIGKGSFTYDPASLVDGAGETSGDITVPGAAFGDFVLISAPYALQGITVTGYVKSAGVISIRVQNESGGTIDLANGAWKWMVIR